MLLDTPAVGRAKNVLDVLQVYGVVPGLSTAFGLAAARLGRRASYDMPIPDSKLRVRLRLADLSDFRVFTDIFVRRCYDLDGFPQSQRALTGSGDMLIVDCGANNGCSSLWFSLRYPNATIVAIEPERGNFALLLENLAQRANVEPLCAAVWDSETELEIVGTDAWAFQTMPANGTSVSDRRTPTVTLDSILLRHPNARRVIVKIDVEGAEGTIFKRQPAWLDRVDVLIIELHDWMLPWQGTARRVLSQVTDYPMDIVIAGECAICFRNRDAGETEIDRTQP